MESTNFNPSAGLLIRNFRVKDMETLLIQLKVDRVVVVREIVEEEYGKFGWILDPEGNKIELREPIEDKL